MPTPGQLGLLAYVPGPGMLFGLLLGAAIIAGYLARMVRIPRIVGYLLAGATVHTIVHFAYDAPSGSENARQLTAAVEPLSAVKDLALGLILFSLGSIFERTHVRAVGSRILKVSLAECGLVFALVLLGTLAVGYCTEPSLRGAALPVLCLLLAALAVETAPAATLYVLHEYEAKGPMSDAILTLTALSSSAAIVLFHVAFQVLVSFGLIQPIHSTSSLWVGLLCTTLGSLTLGVLLGFLVSIAHAKLPLAETLLIFFALFIVLGAGERHLQAQYGITYNTLLTALVIGAVFGNVGIDAPKLFAAIQTLGGPVFVGFFALAGYSLHLADLPRLGLFGAAYVACRAAGKLAGCALGRRWTGDVQGLKPYLGQALLCQASIAIGMVHFVALNWGDPAAQKLREIVLGAIVVFELIGPLLEKSVLRRSGEVKAITLLRRPRAAAAEGESITLLTLGALARAFGLSRHGRSPDPASLQVRHIMRTNVKFLRAQASLDEVLRFVEQSRDNHFPVVDEHDDLLGVIHFSDIHDMIYDPVMRDLVTAVDLADASTPAVATDLPLSELLAVFRAADIGSLPVVEKAGGRRTVGIVEQRDLLRVLHRSQTPD